MIKESKILENHALYGLDTAILNYLVPVLEKMLGEPFREFSHKQELMDLKRQDETRELGRKLAREKRAEDIFLQEDLLGRCFSFSISKAWRTLLAAADPEQRELCRLFGAVLDERCDLRNMAVAQETAEIYGDEAYAAKVREIMDLDSTIGPVWYKLIE